MAWGKNYVINLIYIVSMWNVRVKFIVAFEMEGFLYTHQFCAMYQLDRCY